MLYPEPYDKVQSEINEINLAYKHKNSIIYSIDTKYANTLLNDLYINISRKIFDVLMEEYDKLYEQSKIAETLDMSDLYKEKARKLQRIANNCKMVNYKNSLIRECKPLFTVDEL